MLLTLGSVYFVFRGNATYKAKTLTSFNWKGFRLRVFVGFPNYLYLFFVMIEPFPKVP